MRKKTSQLSIVGKVLKYMKRYIPLLVLSLLLATVTVAMNLYFPIITGDAIDLIVDKGQVEFEGILFLVQKALLVIAIGAVAQWVMNICNNHMTYHIVMDIRKDSGKSKSFRYPIWIKNHTAILSAA